MPIEENLFEMSQAQLARLAKKLDIPGSSQLKGTDLIFKILEFQAAQEGLAFITGCLEITDDGFGFLRFPENNYLQVKMMSMCPDTDTKIRFENGSYGFRTCSFTQRRRKVLCSSPG